MAKKYFFYLGDLIKACEYKASELYFYPVSTNYHVKVAGRVLRISKVTKSFQVSDMMLCDHLTKIIDPTPSCILELSEEQFKLIDIKVPIGHLNLCLYDNEKLASFCNRKKLESLYSYNDVTF